MQYELFSKSFILFYIKKIACFGEDPIGKINVLLRFTVKGHVCFSKESGVPIFHGHGFLRLRKITIADY